jgi:peptidoglycan/LPS O-acetylase OafA/YrhL
MGEGSRRRPTWWPQALRREFIRQPDRPYLYELDRLRIITALSVVEVHVLAFTMFLDAAPSALLTHMGVLMAFHFTREVFMFVTALALVYVYYCKPFLQGSFWKRRGIGVLLPYVIWTLIYTLVNPHPDAPLPLLQTLLINIVTGNASYQLYYILLTIQFYLLFPWFLKFLRRAARRPWLTLGISFALEVALLAFSYYLLPLLPLADSVSPWLGTFLDRFVLDYQFYFVLGAMVALYLPQVRAYVLRHSRWIAGGLIAALVVLALYFVLVTQVGQVDPGWAVVVLQPIMAPYSLAVIAFLYWLAYSRVARASCGVGRLPARGGAGQRVWHALSDSAFGLYLIHPLFLTAILAQWLPFLLSWPSPLLLVLIWLLTCAGSISVTLLLLRLPLLSRLVGREGTARRKQPTQAARLTLPLSPTPEPLWSIQPAAGGD